MAKRIVKGDKVAGKDEKVGTVVAVKWLTGNAEGIQEMWYKVGFEDGSWDWLRASDVRVMRGKTLKAVA